MTETQHCIETDALVEYLYGEAETAARARIDAHLRDCARCADEVRGLKDVRGTLAAWVPPEAELGFRIVSDADPEPVPVSLWGRLGRRPVWGLAAAAVLVLAAAAAITRPVVQVGPDGMVVRIGWSETPPDVGTPPGPEVASQSDLATLEAELRQELQTLRGTLVLSGPVQPAQGDSGVVPGPTGAQDAWLRSVQELISESEQRQARALDTRLGQVEQRVASQAEIAEIERVFAEFDELERQRIFDAFRRASAPR